MKTIIDDQINVAKNNIQKGESTLKMQDSLKRILSAYKEHLKLSEKQVRSYLVRIEALTETKVNNLKINPKFKGAIAGVTLILLSPSLTACNQKQEVIKTETIETDSKEDVLVTMIPKQESKPSLDKESFSYDGMDLNEVKGYLANFINDSLSKGLYSDEENKLSINEEDKEKIAKEFINLYFYLNTKYLADSIYTIYNSENIDFDNIYETSQEAIKRLLDDTYTVTGDSKLLLDRLFIKKTDNQLLRQMYTLIASRNTAGSEEEKKFYIEQVKINFIHLLEEYQNTNNRVSNQTLQYGLELIELVDKFSSEDLINDNDLKEQYTKIYPNLLYDEEKNTYDGHQITLEELKEALMERSKNSFLQKIMNAGDNVSVDKSYQELVKEITEQIRLSSFKPNLNTTSDWLSKEGVTKEIGEEPEEEIKIAENQEVNDMDKPEETKTEENQEINKPNEEVADEVDSKTEVDEKSVEIKAKQESAKRKAIAQAKEDIIVYDRAVEDKEEIPEYDIPTEPNESSKPKDVYDYWYIVTFMEERWELVMKQRFKNQTNQPYLSQNERDQITARAIYDYANELFDTYYVDETSSKKTL